MLCASYLRVQLLAFTRDYDTLQSFAVILIYIQIGCALIGSLGALYSGVCLMNLGIALFALVAIESSSQSLGRTYAFLLFCAIALDISWFILFTHEIWLSSSLLWIQIYRLGASYVDTTSRSADFDLRNGFLSPAPVTPIVARQTSGSNEILGGSVYDPLYYSSMFEDGQENKHSYGMCNQDNFVNDSTEASHKSYVGRSFQAVDEENGPIKMELV